MSKNIHVDFCDDYKVGDMPPSGYVEWHEWAEVQIKGGLRQVNCSRCGLFKFPQELNKGNCGKCSTKEQV